MMTIYLDKDFHCYITENSNTIQSIETDIFNGKCAAYIEGYQYIPEGQSWTRNDGMVFTGEMISPIKNYSIIESVQKLYDEVDINEKENRIASLEEENALIKEENAMLMECLLEMSEIVYA